MSSIWLFLALIGITGAWEARGWAAIAVDVAEAPSTDLALTLKAIKSAKRTLQINAYELTNEGIGEAIRDQILRGVQVNILQEGEPVGGIGSDGIAIRNALGSAMQRSRRGNYRFMEGRRTGVRRFPYDHAKYIIVDSSSLLIGSENYSDNGHPAPGDVGNRGWEVWIHDQRIAQDFANVFGSDGSTRNRDINQFIGFGKVDWSAYEPGATWGALAMAAEPGIRLAAPQQRPGSQTLPASSILPVFSPDTSLRTLIALIRQAKKTLDIEQLTFNSEWGGRRGASPLLAEIVAAAKRGVQVRVLLNDDAAFGGDPGDSDNAETVAQLNSYGRQSRLRLQGRIANLKAMGVDYIHNKGVLVDGYLTLVSSINWNENSVTRNREAGVVLTSNEINRHYSELFDFDWSRSGR